MLFITGNADNAASQLEPGKRVVTKPFALDALLARVDAMLADP